VSDIAGENDAPAARCAWPLHIRGRRPAPSGRSGSDKLGVFTGDPDNSLLVERSSGVDYRERLSGTRATISVRLVARRTAKGNWRGTFRARVVVRRNGRVIDRCRMARATRWGASL